MEELSEVAKAHLEWQQSNNVCNCLSHYNKNGEPKSARHICEREKAWRNYVRIRDNNPNAFKTFYEQGKSQFIRNEE